MLQRGSTLGRYTVVGPLGGGGMGMVFRARDASLERFVAIKVLAPGILDSLDARRRFRQEALALARLSHEHIAAVYDAGEQDGVDYIVMECIEGESLSERLTRGPLPLAEATAICSQVAQALEEAHRQGIIHRDLKPGNIMLTPRGQVRVLDFGLAKLLASSVYEDTISLEETQGLVGTPLYMSPEQISGQAVDARTDLWSLGCVYFELLTGQRPFQADAPLDVMRAIGDSKPADLRKLRAGIPEDAERIVTHALEKNPAARYQNAAQMHADLTNVLNEFSGYVPTERQQRRVWRVASLAAVAAVLVFAALGIWLYQRISHRRWARDEAGAEFTSLQLADRPLKAMAVLKKAERYDSSNKQLQQLDSDNLSTVKITSVPAGAEVSVKDFTSPSEPWQSLGHAPLTVMLPQGLFRWKVAAPGLPDFTVARSASDRLTFDSAAAATAPAGMRYVQGGRWQDFIGMVGWVGPFDLPPFLIDTYEVSNREYQKFVDAGGYENRQYWQETIVDGGAEVPWEQAVERMHDTTGRPGPAGWIAGRYPAGQDSLPVTGISWYEAAAYAVYAGKQLPVLAEWYKAANPDDAAYTVQTSNFAGKAAAPVGSYSSLGPYGTFDMAGNAREWSATSGSGGERFILGGDYNDSAYVYSYPQALLPLDRSAENGFRCVRNLAPLQAAAQRPLERRVTAYAEQKPVSDEVYEAYTVGYAYAESPLDAHVEGVVRETEDFREEKVSYVAPYGDQRVNAYLFLPKRVKPPYQTIVFFPSARVLFLPPGSELGDTQFFDFAVQSGRAVIYPVYQQTYERRTRPAYATNQDMLQLLHDQCKDVGRALDYAATRPDLDSSRMAYLGVSMGAADGAICATMLQGRLRTAIFLDGGIFPYREVKGANAVDFLPRMKKPVLMVNGRYDFTFPLDQSQTPFFNLLGTPADQKQHLLLDTPHDVTEQRSLLVGSVLAWLDKYLGRVSS